MVEYLETVLESSDSKESKMDEQIPVMACSNDRKKHLSQDSAGKTKHSILTGDLIKSVVTLRCVCATQSGKCMRKIVRGNQAKILT